MQTNRETEYRIVANISSPGKIIISGQHSVVYNKDAICAAIDLRCNSQCSLRSSKRACIVIELVNINRRIEIETEQLMIPKYIERPQLAGEYNSYRQTSQKDECHSLYMYKIIRALSVAAATLSLGQEYLKQLYNNIKQMDFKIKIDSHIPVGKGLGSSAAISTCFAASVMCLLQVCVPIVKAVDNKQLINSIAFEYQKIYHANPSGVDNSISTFGGIILYNRQIAGLRRLQWRFPDLKIGLVDSQVQKNTKKAVQHVKTLYDEGRGKEIIQKISQTTALIVKAMEEQRLEVFMKAIMQNHQLLVELGLSNTSIDKIVEQNSKSELSVCKITGAGMGGYVLIFSKQTDNISGIRWTSISSQGLKVLKDSSPSK